MALWDEIELAIAPYQNEGATIQFANAELVVMAVICIVRRRPYLASKGMISGWISSNFPSWRFHMFNTLGRVCIDDALRSYEIPLCGAHMGMGAVSDSSNTFTMPLREGRVFLSNVLEPPRRGPFRFLDLPAEIRVRVYEMLFSYPKIIVAKSLANEDGPTKLWVRKREHQIGYECEDQGAYVHTQPLQRILAILSTNKQIYREADPVFYQINDFMLTSMIPLSTWVRKVAPNRFQHIRHLSFRHTPSAYSGERSKARFATLSNLNQLKSLEIDLQDHDWLKSSSNRRGRPRRCGKYSDPCDVPGIEGLVKLVGVAETFRISGDCPRIREYVLKMRGQPDRVVRVQEKSGMGERRAHLQDKPQNTLARRRARRLQASLCERSS